MHILKSVGSFSSKQRPLAGSHEYRGWRASPNPEPRYLRICGAQDRSIGWNTLGVTSYASPDLNLMATIIMHGLLVSSILSHYKIPDLSLSLWLEILGSDHLMGAFSRPPIDPVWIDLSSRLSPKPPCVLYAFPPESFLVRYVPNIAAIPQTHWQMRLKVLFPMPAIILVALPKNHPLLSNLWSHTSKQAAFSIQRQWIPLTN